MKREGSPTIAALVCIGELRQFLLEKKRGGGLYVSSGEVEDG